MLLAKIRSKRAFQSAFFAQRRHFLHSVLNIFMNFFQSPKYQKCPIPQTSILLSSNTLFTKRRVPVRGTSFLLPVVIIRRGSKEYIAAGVDRCLHTVLYHTDNEAYSHRLHGDVGIYAKE